MTTYTAPSTAAVTPEVLKILRTADNVTFRHLADGTGQIQAVKYSSSKGGWETPTCYKTFDVPSVVTDFTKYGEYNHKAYAEMDTSCYGSHAGFWDIVKTGDAILLEWYRNNDCPAMTDLGVHRDELHLILLRGTKRMRFLISVKTSTADSMARMIKTA